ncbi:MAG: hypothetical protein RSD95_14395 [Clostridia bacterium]
MTSLTQSQRQELAAIRRALDGYIPTIATSTVAVNDNLPILRAWKPRSYAVGDVRMYEGIPYRCTQAHDSASNTGWTPPTVPALWMQYHGTSAATARPWVQPLGAHDMYKVGEYMVWTDAQTYKCAQDTTYTPAALPGAWAQIPAQ